MYSFSAFSDIPLDLCGDSGIPEFPQEQFCTAYAQKKSEISGLIIRPNGASIPPGLSYLDWANWGTYIDNTDPAKVHLLGGVGTFLPTEKTTVSLAGGRVEEVRERKQRLTFAVTNMSGGHIVFAKKLQNGYKEFAFYLLTTEDQLLLPNNGFRPVFVDADFVFDSGQARNKIVMTIDTEMVYSAWNLS